MLLTLRTHHFPNVQILSSLLIQEEINVSTLKYPNTSTF